MKLPSSVFAVLLVSTPVALTAAPDSPTAEPSVTVSTAPSMLKMDTSTVGLAKADKEKVKKELAAMEDAFCEMGKTKGLLAAFKFYAAPDVAFIDTDPRKWRGLPAVVERIGPDLPGESLTWSADYTDVSDDGTMGFNYGRYKSRHSGIDGKTSIHTGWFLTIWKRQPDGSWKYVMASGAPDRPAPKSVAPRKN